jgi:hypothetical protein
MLGLFWVSARGLTVLFGATDFFTVGAGVFSGVIEGVTFLTGRRVSYGPAVAGLVSSGLGRIGRRTVPLIREPVPLGFDPNADLVELPESPDGGRAVAEEAVDALDVALDPRDFADCDLTGE